MGRDRLNKRSITQKSWGNSKLVQHFYFGRGRGVTLSKMGLLDLVRNEADRLSISRPGGFKDQIRREVIRVKNGVVFKKFDNSYSFEAIQYSLGGGSLTGEFVGRCTLNRNARIEFSGNMHIKYSDRFIDPLNIIKYRYGDSNSPRAPEWLRDLADVGGIDYPITGSWSESFSRYIKSA